MQNTFISTSVIATALALTSVVAIAADAANRSSSDFGQKGSQAIVGKLVSLSDYLGTDDQAATSNFRSTTTSSAQTSQTAPRSGSDANQLGSQAGKSGGLAGARNDSSTSLGRDTSTTVGRDTSTTVGRDTSTSLGRDASTSVGRDSSTSLGRDQKNSQGSTLTDQSENRLSASSFDSSKEQTLVLIAQQGGMQGAQGSLGGVTGTSTNRQSSGQFGSSQGGFGGSSTMAAGGQAYILVFGADSSSQSAYRKAKGMISEGSSNWATSGSEAGDRIPVRGQDDARPGATRDYTHQADSTTTGRADQRDSAGKWSKTGSQVRVTGELVGRGGIQAIRVSEISLASMLSDPSSKSSGSADPTSPSHNNSGKSESNDKKAR